MGYDYGANFFLGIMLTKKQWCRMFKEMYPLAKIRKAEERWGAPSIDFVDSDQSSEEQLDSVEQDFSIKSHDHQEDSKEIPQQNDKGLFHLDIISSAIVCGLRKEFMINLDVFPRDFISSSGSLKFGGG